MVLDKRAGGLFYLMLRISFFDSGEGNARIKVYELIPL